MSDLLSDLESLLAARHRADAKAFAEIVQRHDASEPGDAERLLEILDRRRQGPERASRAVRTVMELRQLLRVANMAGDEAQAAVARLAAGKEAGEQVLAKMHELKAAGDRLASSKMRDEWGTLDADLRRLERVAAITQRDHAEAVASVTSFRASHFDLFSA